MPHESSIPFGFCYCGCGERTSIALRTRGKRGNVKGQPLFYINGHNGANRRELEEAKPFKIDGVYCRLVPLTQGLWTIVWESDYAWLMQWRWQAKRKQNGFYACRSERKNGRVRYISMHRVILDMDDDDPRFGDHANLNPLDNRRSNLRSADRHESQCNRRTPKSNKWGCKGLSKARSGKIRVRIYVKGDCVELPNASSLEEAKKIYRDGLMKHHGNFAQFR